jgi:hypothetical protein
MACLAGSSVRAPSAERSPAAAGRTGRDVRVTLSERVGVENVCTVMKFLQHVLVVIGW